MTGRQIVEEAVTGSRTFRPFVCDETNVGALCGIPISNTTIKKEKVNWSAQLFKT